MSDYSGDDRDRIRHMIADSEPAVSDRLQQLLSPWALILIGAIAGAAFFGAGAAFMTLFGGCG